MYNNNEVKVAINFSIGDVLIPNIVYVDKTLTKFPSTPTIKQSLEILGALAQEPSTVAASGTTSFPIKSYIRIVPNDTSHRFYNKGLGVNVYFANDERLNDSFEFSTAFIEDKCFLKVLNNSGSPITKDQIVRQTGFDTTMQLATIALADATTDTSAVVFGITVEDITDGEMGSILTDGSVQIDTSAFSISDAVFLSDTPGAISTTAGTVSTTVGRVLTVGADGTMSMFSSLTGGGGGGGGFFTDGSGTDAAIGKGATAPIAAGVNSLAQGDGCSAPGPNSFAQGQNCIADGIYSFAQGRNCDTKSSDNTFIQGYNCDALGGNSYSTFVQGLNSRAGYSGFAQGKNVQNYGSYVCFASGGGISIAVPGTYDSAGVFAQGYGHTLERCYSVFAQGYDNSATTSNPFFQIRESSIQGKDNTIYATSDINGIFIQGKTNTVNSSHSFAQGESNTIDKLSLRCFIQGRGNDVGIYNISGSPSPNGSENSFIQGYNNRVFRDSPQTFVQGLDNSIGGYTGFGQGRNNFLYGYACFVQGGGNYAGNSADPAYISVQGGLNTVSGRVGATFVQGAGNNVYGGASGPLDFHSNFIQGVYNTIGVVSTLAPTTCFLQGRDNTISSAIDRAFGQGRFVKITRDDQKTWGSNRGVLGAAQTSKIVKHVQTTTASQITLLTFDLEEDKTYSIKINIAARNTTTTTEGASFILAQAVAYRDTAGSAVLVGSPVALTRADTGGGSVNLLADLASSGNNLLLRVTGEAGQTYEWCADFEFVEVAG
jgi:hypothetical protein